MDRLRVRCFGIASSRFNNHGGKERLDTVDPVHFAQAHPSASMSGEWQVVEAGENASSEVRNVSRIEAELAWAEQRLAAVRLSEGRTEQLIEDRIYAEEVQSELEEESARNTVPEPIVVPQTDYSALLTLSLDVSLAVPKVLPTAAPVGPRLA